MCFVSSGRFVPALIPFYVALLCAHLMNWLGAKLAGFMRERVHSCDTQAGTLTTEMLLTIATLLFSHPLFF